ncbi:cytochrome P450 [Sistotremastrum suecicum HHB10207 ss-3]|uniref:Cytochrome P450 n=1 Tax=Sistotremastrum suecicum HHB10207 ss-3 TaxID=1314776 RepID=A0A165Y4A3_9AGAM|nr:cytochrome P450 [Sistotremastrum suecicum HHB10207 ss-3]
MGQKIASIVVFDSAPLPSLYRLKTASKSKRMAPASYLQRGGLLEVLGTLATALLVWVICQYIYKFCSNHSRLPYPPGPNGLPILGNALQIKIEKPWILYKDWASVYGDVIGLKVLGKRVVVLNSFQSGLDLFERRGKVFAGRPAVPLLSQVAGWDFTLLAMDYTKSLRLTRRLVAALVAQFANSSAALKELHPLLTLNAHRLALKMSSNHDPTSFHAESRASVSRIILELTYGYQVKEGRDEWIRHTELMSESLTALGMVGAHPIDVFP